jgi:hypothetical protein
MVLGILILSQGVGLEISVGIVEHAIYFILFGRTRKTCCLQNKHTCRLIRRKTMHIAKRGQKDKPENVLEI